MKQARQFTLFVVIGGVATLVNLGARILFDTVTTYEIAILLAFPVALSTAFILNRSLVFRPRQGSWSHQYWRFFLVNLATLIQVFAISVFLARLIFPSVGFTWHADTVAHALGLITPLFTSFWAHKRFSFAAGEPPVSEAR